MLREAEPLLFPYRTVVKCDEFVRVSPPSACSRERRFGWLWSFLLLLAWPFVSRAQFIYTTNNDTVAIVRYTGSGGAVSIPGVINGLPVTVIGTGAFSNCSTLTAITLPSSLASIGSNAFASCHYLASVTLSNGLATIGDYAFNGCSSVSSISIPASVTTIGNYAFTGCVDVSHISLAVGLAAIGDYAFNGCMGVVSVSIPASVTNIGTGALPVFCISPLGVPICATNLLAITVDPDNVDYLQRKWSVV